MENEIVESLNKISDSLKNLEKSAKSISNIVVQFQSLDNACLSLSHTTRKLNSISLKEYLDTFESVYGVLKKVTGVDNDFNELGKKIQSSFTSFGKFIGLYSDVSEVAKSSSDAISNGLEVVAGSSEQMVLAGGEAVASMASISTAAEGAAASTGLFSSAMSFMAAHPIGVAITAIGLLAGALMAFSQIEMDSLVPTSKFYEAQAKKRDEIDEVTESLKRNSEALKDNYNAIHTDYSVVLSQVDELVSLTGENGYVGNVNKAKYLIDQINSILPNSVELVDGNKVVWKDLTGAIIDNTDKIKENIESLKQRSIVEAFQESYIEAIKNEASVTSERIKAENALNEAKERYMELQLREFDLTDAEMKEKGELMVQMDNYRATISSCDEQLIEIQNTTNDFMAAQRSLSRDTEDMADFLVEQYTRIGDNGEITWESLGTGLMDLDARMKAHTDGVKVMSDSEISYSQRAREIIVEDMINKAKEYGYTYDEMISVLKDEGIYLNKEEKALFEDGLKNVSDAEREKQRIKKESMDFMNTINQSGLSALNENTIKNLQISYELFKKNGVDQGVILCDKLVESIEKNNGRVTGEMIDIVEDIQNLASEADPTVKINVDTQQAKKDSKSFFDSISDWGRKFTFDFLGHFSVGEKRYASGGFPTTGELFIAREAGPELVGRIHGKSAVANNDQIVQGISNGVYNAVKSAMVGQGNGHMNIHATFVMDGEVVGKQVIKYHNGVVKRTGTTPLMI